MTTAEGAFVLESVFKFEAVDWTVLHYKLKYADYFGIRPFNAMFFDGRNTNMYDRSGVKRDTDMGGWKSCWSLMESFCQAYLDLIGFLDMPSVTH